MCVSSSRPVLCICHFFFDTDNLRSPLKSPLDWKLKPKSNGCVCCTELFSGNGSGVGGGVMGN